MNKLQSLARIFKLEPGEERPFLLLFSHSFFLGLSLITFFTASHALFLAQFEAKILPFVYMGGAVAGTVAGWVYTKLKQRFPLTKLLPGTLLFLLLSVCGFRLALALTDSWWPIFGMLTWHTVLAAMMSVVFWGLAGQIFNVRQGKRLFGITGSGELLAAMLGGLVTPLFVSFLGTANLLLVSAVGLLLCLVVLLAILRIYGARLTGATTATTSPTAPAVVDKSRFVDLLKDRYIRSVFLLATVGVIAFRFVDYVFLDLAGSRYTDEDELARFFGLFFGITQGLTLVVLTGVTGRVISRYGIAAGLGVRRKSLTIFTILMIALSFWSAQGALALFLLASATKMVDLILGRSLTGPAFLILYQPLRAEKRIPTQLAVASTFGPIAGGFAGVVLFVMNQVGLSEVLYFNLALLIVLVCWRFVSKQVNAGYRETLPKALERRRLEGTALALDEVGLVDALSERLGSERPQEAIYALELLVKSQPEHQERFLVDLLEHPHPQVRHDVLQRIFHGAITQLQAAVEHRVETETEPFVRAAAVLALCELSESDAVDSVGPLLDAEEPEVRKAAMAGLLRRGGIDGVLLAGERLVGLERSERPHERELAASVLGEVGERSFYRQLLPLLDDPEPRVRRAALAAAGAVRHRRLWPAVLDHLSTRTTNRAPSPPSSTAVMPLYPLWRRLSATMRHRHRSVRGLPISVVASVARRLFASSPLTSTVLTASRAWKC